MTLADNTEVHARTLTALFDTHDAANRAVTDLVAAGIPREHIDLRSGDTAAASTSATHEGFWDSVKDMFMPEEDRYSYAEGLKRGGYLVSVRADEANYNRVIDLLDREGSVDMDQRESTWRSEGWTGYQASTASGPAAFASTGAGSYTGSTAGVSTATRLATATETDGVAAATGAGREDVIPVYEERLNVGKRDVSHGRVRLRSYVVETPVSEHVSLHSESVQVERRPVDRAIGVGDVAFKDRVIEAEERAEEAVISKTARVTEEVSLRKVAENESRTVSDSVRRTEVEVDDERSGHALAKTTEAVPSAVPDRKI